MDRTKKRELCKAPKKQTQRRNNLIKNIMNKKKFIEKMKHEVFYAFYYFENSEIISPELIAEINTFFELISEFDSIGIYEKVNEKYGWLLTYYRESKRNADITTIKNISKFFLILTIVGIIIGIILQLSFLTT